MGASQRDWSDENTRDSQLISKLVARIMDLSRFALKSTNVSQTKPRPVSMSFKATHNTQFDLPDRQRALLYMSLPLSNYSALDTKYVYRDRDTDSDEIDNDGSDTFRFSLPLYDFTSALSFPIDAILTTEFVVAPDPMNGKISVHSRPVYFLPSNRSLVQLKNSVSTQSMVTIERSIDPSQRISLNHSFPPLEEQVDYGESLLLNRHIKTNNSRKEIVKNKLPYWLVWGDETLMNTNTTIDGSKKVLKSSIQLRINIQMMWDQDQKKTSLPSRFNLWGRGAGNQSVMSQEIDKTLCVKAKAQVEVDINIPMNGTAAAVLSLAPVKLLMAQVCSIVTSAVMRGLAPIFIEALGKDYEERIHVLDNSI